MNIRSAFFKTITILEPIFNHEEINNEKILQCIRRSWREINKFSKQIDRRQTDNIGEFLEGVCYPEIPLTNEMLEEARDIYHSLKKEKEVKLYLDQYFLLVKTLLVFSRPLDETCDICQDSLVYMIDDSSNDLYKECVYCGRLTAVSSNISGSLNSGELLRPAKRSELRLFFNEACQGDGSPGHINNRH